jgi:hypothetical protein
MNRITLAELSVILFILFIHVKEAPSFVGAALPPCETG